MLVGAGAICSGCSHTDPGEAADVESRQLGILAWPPICGVTLSEVFTLSWSVTVSVEQGWTGRSGSMKFLVHVKFLIHSLAPKSYFSLSFSYLGHGLSCFFAKLVTGVTAWRAV